MVESSGLLNRRTGLNLYRGFESLPLRQTVWDCTEAKFFLDFQARLWNDSSRWRGFPSPIGEALRRTNTTRHTAAYAAIA